MAKQDRLFKELDAIHDAYEVDVRQFIAFIRERRLLLVEALKEYAVWLEEEHEGRRYSPATINRKIAAAKNRVRYAFKHSSSADNLRKRYQLEEVLGEVKPKRIERGRVPAEKVLDVDEIKRLIRETRDATIKLIVTFLFGTGVRVSEMLAIQLSDLQPEDVDFVQIRIVGRGGRERRVHAKASFIDSVRTHFHGNTYLFEHDGKPFNRISVTNRIKHESLRTIGREVTAHHLRHTWAMMQIQQGKDARAIARALGHVDPGLTATMYSDRTLHPREAFLDLTEDDDQGEGGDERPGRT
jgi:integrase